MKTVIHTLSTACVAVGLLVATPSMAATVQLKALHASFGGSQLMAAGTQGNSPIEYTPFFAFSTDGGTSWKQTQTFKGTQYTYTIGAVTQAADGKTIAASLTADTDQKVDFLIGTGPADWSTPTPTGKNHVIRAIASLPTRDVAVGDAGYVITRETGQDTWTRRDKGAIDTQNLRAITVAGTELIAVGDQGNIAVSADNGDTWTSQTPPDSSALFFNSVTGTGAALANQPIAVDANGTIMMRTNNTAWQQMTKLGGVTLYGIAWSNALNMGVAVGD